MPAAGLIDPVCREPDAVLRERRGGAWNRPLAEALATTRSASFGGARPKAQDQVAVPLGTIVDAAQGFRCAYVEAGP